MTNNNNSKVQNSGQKARDSTHSPQDIYKLTEKYENVKDESQSSSNSLDKIGDKPEQVKSSSEVCVDITDNNDIPDDEIPEEVWEQEEEQEGKQEVQITERKTSQTDKLQANIDIANSSPETNQESTSHKGGIGSTVLCFGYTLSQFKWVNIIYLVVLHVYAIYAYYHSFVNPVMLGTVIWAVAVATTSGFGASAGAHRLWAHRAYKAKAFLKGGLVWAESMAVNGSCYSYARDHRNHHKFVDTDADPKNARRGFWFAHIGWWCVKKNAKVLEAGRKLSHKDLHDDKILMFQHKYYIPMAIAWAVIFPTAIPYYCWGEDLLTAFNVCVVLRIVFVLHHLFTVNSIAHIFGKRPYDKSIGPTESKITMYLSLGEGSHNYHHSFPMDYANCEKKWWEVFNPATLFIDCCAGLGLAYDLKKPSPQVVQGIIQRKGNPDYFEHKMKRSLCTRITLGFVDWVCGFHVALYSVWIPVAFKAATGRPIIYYG